MKSKLKIRVEELCAELLKEIDTQREEFFGEFECMQEDLEATPPGDEEWPSRECLINICHDSWERDVKALEHHWDLRILDLEEGLKESQLRVLDPLRALLQEGVAELLCGLEGVMDGFREEFLGIPSEIWDRVCTAGGESSALSSS